jgi:L-asparaginase
VSTASRPGLAEAAIGLGAKGLVIAATGAGSCGNLDGELAAISSDRRAVVVRSSRVGEGRVVRDDNWQHPHMVAADNLSPQKAALLLALALAQTDDAEEIQRMFGSY